MYPQDPNYHADRIVISASKSFGISSALYFGVSDKFHSLPTLLATSARLNFWDGVECVCKMTWGGP